MTAAIRRRIGACAAALTLAACGTTGSHKALNLEQDCGALRTSIAATAVGLPSAGAAIESATLVAAAPLAIAERGPTPAARITPALPAFCRVIGQLPPLDPSAPPIKFQVNLPLKWNGRSVQYGGGGFNGVLISGLGLLPAARFDKPAPLAAGYVTVGTDSGHQNAPGVPPQVFALNDEALVNFAHASYKKVRDVSVALMERAYGRRPDRMYFVGSSEGGREGLTMAQRYPRDFDGILSRVPVIHWTGLQFAGTRNGAATMGDGWIRPAQVKLVHEAVLAACDAADGLADGIVSDAAGCNKRFDITKLQCAPGAGGDTCLGEAQVRAVKTLHSNFRFPFKLENGLDEYPGWGVSGENTPAFGPTGGWNAWWLGTQSPTLPPQATNGIAWIYGSGAVQYFYARDPNYDVRNVRVDDLAPRIAQISSIMDATNPDLGAFRAHGGKLIVLENMADYAQSPYAGIGYYESVVAKMGRPAVEGFMRLYTAPGVDHVGSGAPANADLFPALVDWVERGRAPAGLQLVEQPVQAPFGATRTRPLCEWPQWPRYRSGDPNDARSFACTQ